MPPKSATRAYNGYSAARPAILGLTKTLILCLSRFQSVTAAPLTGFFRPAEDGVPESEGDSSLWFYLSVAVVLVLLGGAFAGLTIA
jgi:metal transporter CNNM